MLEARDYFINDIYSIKINFERIYNYYRIYNYMAVTNNELYNRFEKNTKFNNNLIKILQRRNL